ncbi:MAG: DUF4252 domain-containing protein [Candidatus Symbiothrix sp.]|jgi:hypothetical protein|nr:DUF4252 domain-containing protein [Candidatus Symbiothrix sp.]
MKTKSLLTVLLLFTAMTGFAQNDLFDKLADRKDITQVTITKALLNMVPGVAASVDMNGVDIKDMMTKLEQIDVFTSEENSAKQMMRKEITAHFKNNKSYEVLMKIKDKANDVVFYSQKDGDFIQSLVMFVSGDDECVLIRLLGKFTTQDIRKITESAQK